MQVLSCAPSWRPSPNDINLKTAKAGTVPVLVRNLGDRGAPFRVTLCLRYLIFRLEICRQFGLLLRSPNFVS
jgi:hypothetical protein